MSSKDYNLARPLDPIRELPEATPPLSTVCASYNGKTRDGRCLNCGHVPYFGVVHTGFAHHAGRSP